jgi:hypothetical protein
MTGQNFNLEHAHNTPFWSIAYKSSYHVILHSMATDSNTEELYKHYIDRYTKQEQHNQEVGNE